MRHSHISGRWARLALAGLFLACPQAWGFGLLEAYRAALINDPTYRSATFEREAGLQAEPLARAALLPKLDVQGSYSNSWGSREFPSVSSTGKTSNITQSLNYVTELASLNLRVPLLNPEGIARYLQSGSQESYAEAVFSVRSNELMNRLSTAYFDLLLALDTQQLARAQVEAYREQAKLAARNFKGGEGTLTEVAEAESRQDLADAQLFEADNTVDVARRNLQNVTGLNPEAISPVRGDFEPPAIKPASMNEWLDLAVVNSPTLQAKRFALETARDEVNAVRAAGNLPKIDAMGSLSYNSSPSINTLGYKYSTGTAGVQISMPLYSGGYVSALTDKAIANMRQAESDLDVELNTTKLEIKRQFLAVNNGMAKIEAYKKAVKSSEVALEGTRQGLKAGIRTNVEVLNAEQQGFSAKRDLAKAKYDYLVARLKLKIASGILTAEDVAEIERLLAKDSKVG
jgi:protease secretion system outer membrane protein